MNTAMLAKLQAAQTRSLTSSATHKRGSSTDNSFGGSSVSMETLGTLSVRVGDMGNRPTDQAFMDKYAPKNLKRVTVPAGSDVLAGDQLIVSGVTYTVLEPLKHDNQTALVCICSYEVS